MRAPITLRSATWLTAAALLLVACSNRPSRRIPDPPAPRPALEGIRGAGAPVRAATPLSPEGLKTCIAWRDRLSADSASIDAMDRQVSAMRRSLDDEQRQLAIERAAVDTRYLQQVKDYGRHVEENRRRVQAWNTQVDAYNARVVAYNGAARTFQSGCASRMSRNADFVQVQAGKGAGGAVPTRTP